MKKKHPPVLALAVLLWTVALLLPAATAATYYVSAAGDDAADGLSASSPWLTVAKINATKFAPGDAVLFKRGDAWRGGQALYGSSNGTSGHPIVFSAYGEGPKPRLLGSLEISAAKYWTKYADNIWRTTAPINL